MAYWLAPERTVQAEGVISRFDPRFWTVNFPRPMMAAVVATAADALRVDAVFYRRDDLAGLIWESADRHDHPLLAYETRRDYRDCTLSFRWRSGGVLPLDAVNGPTLTVEGRDRSGAPRAWYVRLWNYARGTPTDAQVTIDFAALAGGFLLPGEADPVWAGDIDRMFVSLVAPGYTGAAGDLAAPVEGWAELTAIVCSGPGSVLAIGDVIVPEHGLGIASGYDDSYDVTPQRLLRGVLQLGYRRDIIHYVGMSHYQRLEAAAGGHYASLTGGALNASCAAWHRALASEAKRLGYGIIWSLSYELFDAYCWGDWKQRAADGSPALTGWVPPSTLLSPANDSAMAYLRQVAQAFIAIGVAAGLSPQFQVGEPWWWITSHRRPCLYDAAAKAKFGGSPPVIADIGGVLTATEKALLDAAGDLLAQSTAALVTAVKAVAPGVRTHLLAYLPTLLDPSVPEAARVNLPAAWASPAFDILQIEDYDWVASGNTAAHDRAIPLIQARLGYPPARQHYLAGFVARPEDRTQWRAIERAALDEARRGVTAVYLWALPQVLRDGFVHFALGEDSVQAFDDVLFPLALGREAEVTPEFSTAIVTSAGGEEVRNAGWAAARTSYDVGPGIRSESDMAALLGFFRARMGPARGFRLRDPFDSSSANGGGDPGPLDQVIGTGDGVTSRFALVKSYGEASRRITRPVAGSVRASVAGRETTRFAVEDAGWIAFDTPPPAGAAVTAGYRFDVPVRFTEDRLSVTRATFLAGSAQSVPLTEIRES